VVNNLNHIEGQGLPNKSLEKKGFSWVQEKASDPGSNQPFRKGWDPKKWKSRQSHFRQSKNY